MDNEHEEKASRRESLLGVSGHIYDHYLEAYILDRLSAVDRGEIDKHIAECSLCRQDLDDMHEIYKATEEREQ